MVADHVDNRGSEAAINLIHFISWCWTYFPRPPSNSALNFSALLLVAFCNKPFFKKNDTLFAVIFGSRTRSELKTLKWNHVEPIRVQKLSFETKFDFIETVFSFVTWFYYFVSKIFLVSQIFLEIKLETLGVFVNSTNKIGETSSVSGWACGPARRTERSAKHETGVRAEFRGHSRSRSRFHFFLFMNNTHYFQVLSPKSSWIPQKNLKK